MTLATLAVIWVSDAAGMLFPALLSGLLCVIGFSHGLLVANAIISSMQKMGSHSGSASGIGSATHMVFGAISGTLIISLGGATNFAICIIINITMALVSILAARAALREA